MNTLILAGAGLAIATSSAALAQAQQPARTDRVHTRAEVAQQVGTMFARLDGNRDGFITQEEARAARVQRRAERGGRAADPARQQERAARAFQRIDANGDGAISQAEFAARRATRGETGQPRVGRLGMSFGGRMFGMADANRDSRVSLQEATAAALQHFDRIDLNRDGQVTREERQQARQQLRQQRG
jgi:hypothetical protein